MATNVKQAILKAKVEGAIVELLVKSDINNVYYDETTTLASKLATMITDIDARMKTTDVESAIEAAKNAVRQELLGDTPVEAYNTFTELAQYIAEHKDAADALTEAIGNKADKTTVEAIQATVDALGSIATLNEIGEDNLSAALKAKINTSSEANHSHANKALLDTYTQTEEDLADAVAKKHAHENKAVLDGITSTTVAEWNAKADIFYAATEPSNLGEGDLWVQLIG